MALTLELFPLILFACGALFVLLILRFKIKADSFISKDESEFLPLKPEIADTDTQIMRAVVCCSPERNISQKRLQYDRMTDCRLFKELYENEIFCEYGCLGYGTCVSYCPQKAIIIHNSTAIITDSCTGCGLCVDKCPQKIIQLVPVEKEYYIQCSATGIKQNENCAVGCQNCGLCSETMSLSLELANKCPTKRIQKISFSNKISFKIKHLLYNSVSKKRNKR
ncbi:MAG: 4Fe-4S binding protein [Treponema sp.]|nr:4Fe-4S binding protein [Candidatus Treponema caballi]